MRIHDQDCAVVLSKTESAVACTCREQRRDRKARRDRHPPRAIFDGAVSLGNGNYYRRPLPTPDGN
jgi:hypothetical protein